MAIIVVHARPHKRKRGKYGRENFCYLFEKKSREREQCREEEREI